jgi:hypothetical protein
MDTAARWGVFYIMVVSLSTFCLSVCLPVRPPACLLLLFYIIFQGFVYLQYDSPAGAQAAKQVLHGRFYNGHRIEAEYQFVQMYNQFFGLQ